MLSPVRFPSWGDLFEICSEPLYSAEYLKVLIDHITVRLIRSDLIVFYIVQSASTRSVFFFAKIMILKSLAKVGLRTFLLADAEWCFGIECVDSKPEEH